MIIYMKKILLFLTLMTVALTTWAQEETPMEKHSINTNSFWANWFVQANVVGSSFWGSQEASAVKFSKLTKDYRTNLGLSIAIGKWFTPGIGLRTKMNGFWGRSIISEDKAVNANKYWTLQEQVLLNLSNLLMGYNEQRCWNFIPYAGGGIGHSITYDHNTIGLTLGLLNTFRITKKLAANLDINYGFYEPRFDGIADYSIEKSGLKYKDRIVNVEVGLTYRLGRSTWKHSPDIEAMQALSQSEIDALNAQLSDALTENDRLNAELDAQPKEQQEVRTDTINKVLTAPVSVFFPLNKATISSRRDLQNVAALADVARKNGARLVVTGYADSMTGSADRNRQLSQQRADVVADELVKMGFDRSQIDIVSAGGVDTLNPQAYNRRAIVEIKQ